jgi:hypothetical protein
MVSGASAEQSNCCQLTFTPLTCLLFYATTDKEAQQKDRDNILKSKNVSAAQYPIVLRLLFGCGDEVVVWGLKGRHFLKSI